jgi:SAM-dependent methyltransferase
VRLATYNFYMLITRSDFGTITRELRPDLETMRAAVLALPPEKRRWAAHLNRRGVILQYAYYVALVRRFLPMRDASILDWGAQYGHVTRLLSRYYPSVHCYNPVDDAEHERFYGYDPLCDDFQDLFGIPHDARMHGTDARAVTSINRPSASYDAVVASGVLEHVREQYGGIATEADALSEIRRVLKPNGLLFIWNLPSRFGAVEGLNRLLRRSVHPFTYTETQIRGLLATAGFEVVALDHHEFLNLSSRDRLGRLIGHERAWQWDYAVSRLWPLRYVAQHFTIVARAHSGTMR